MQGEEGNKIDSKDLSAQSCPITVHLDGKTGLPGSGAMAVGLTTTCGHPALQMSLCYRRATRVLSYALACLGPSLLTWNCIPPFPSMLKTSGPSYLNGCIKL